MKLCRKEDQEKLMAYLNQNAPLNLFFIGDIENFGFDQDFQKVYMDEDEAGIHAVDLVYRGNLCLMSYEQKTDQEFLDELIQKYKIKVISGEASLMEKYSFPDHPAEEKCFFARMNRKNEMCDTSMVKRVEEEDIPALVKLTEEIFHTGSSVKEKKKNIESHSGRDYAVFQDGKIVSAASSTAECSSLAMIVGVCTDPAYRDRHYASACVTKLANDLIDEGKTLCLFYNNPSAARIYKALGFEDIGKWTMRKREND